MDLSAFSEFEHYEPPKEPLFDSSGKINLVFFEELGIDLETEPFASEAFFKRLKEVWPAWKHTISEDKPHEIILDREKELLADFLKIAKAIDSFTKESENVFNPYEPSDFDLHIMEMNAITSESDGIFIEMICPEIAMETNDFKDLGKFSDQISIHASNQPDKVCISWFYGNCYRFTDPDNPPD